MQRVESIMVSLTPLEKQVARSLALAEGESVSVIVRRLIRTEAKARGLWPVPKQGEQPGPAQAVPDAERQ
jgi:hypothetical protein